MMAKRLPLFLSLVLSAHAVNVNPSQTMQRDFHEDFHNLGAKMKDTVGKTAEHFRQEMIEKSVIAGNILPLLKRFVVTPQKLRAIGTDIYKIMDWEDLLFIALLGWATVPLVTALHKPNDRGAVNPTASFHVADNLSQIAKIALLVYAVDIFKVILFNLGFQYDHISDMPQAFAKVAYTIWVANRLSVLKKHVIWRTFNVQTESQMGREQIVDRLADAAILAIVGFCILDILSVELGLAGKSFVAVGSLSTLVVSLASQGLLSQVLNGLLLSASDRIYEGDNVRFGNGVSGTVVKMGWMETVLRGSDELMLTVPNADLTSERVSNLSRIRKCQVEQVLKFQYKDVDNLEQLCEDIKSEIRASCRALIKDGTRPFRAFWTGFQDDHLEVTVDAHFNIQPVGDEYWRNRQQVLLAINRAVKKNKCAFAAQQ
jgi:small-conductance mechanosensitive channel